MEYLFNNCKYKYIIFDRENELHQAFLENILFDVYLCCYYASFTQELEYATKEMKNNNSENLAFIVYHNDSIIGAVIVGLNEASGWIGYVINPIYRKKGYATSIIAEFTGWLFSNFPKIKCLYADVSIDNIYSQKALVKSGFDFEREDTLDGAKYFTFYRKRA